MCSGDVFSQLIYRVDWPPQEGMKLLTVTNLPPLTGATTWNVPLETNPIHSSIALSFFPQLIQRILYLLAGMYNTALSTLVKGTSNSNS